MTTEHDLDAQLQAARGLRDADLPALSAAFLDYVHASDAQAPDAHVTPVRVLSPVSAETPASVLAAQQLVDDAHQRHGGGVARSRQGPGRKALLRVGGALIAVATAWTTAVAVAPSDPARTPDGGTVTPTDHIGANEITLVAAEAVTFPLSLDPVPEGLTPTFSRSAVSPDAAELARYTADYRSADGDGLTLWLSPEDPRAAADPEFPVKSPDQHVAETGTVTVNGSRAEFVHGVYGPDSKSFTDLLWERPDGRWVRILGDSAYGETAAVVAVAESLVDRPQPVGLQFGLAPAGWSVSGYEESRSMDLVSDADPQQLLRLSVYRPGPGTTIDTLIEGQTFVSPVESVTIKGQPGRLALKDGDLGNPDFWYVVGQFSDGRIFLLLAPETLSREQVLEIAEQIIHAP